MIGLQEGYLLHSTNARSYITEQAEKEDQIHLKWPSSGTNLQRSMIEVFRGLDVFPVTHQQCQNTERNTVLRECKGWTHNAVHSLLYKM